MKDNYFQITTKRVRRSQ